MANVGNLFVNISGNTKGLTKSLANAKSSIQGFGKYAMSVMSGIGKGGSNSMPSLLGDTGGTGGGMSRKMSGIGKGVSNSMSSLLDDIGGGMSRKTAKHAAGMFDVLGVKRAGQSAEGDLKGAKQTQKMQALYKPGAEQHARYSQAQARMVTSATLGVLGLTVAGVSIMASKALSQVSSAKEGVDRFRYLGPSGDRVIAAEIAMLNDSILNAQKPVVSEALAERAEARTRAQQDANASGGTTISLDIDTFMERLGQAFTNAISGLINDPIMGLTSIMTPGGGNPTMTNALAAARNTNGAAPP
tara:strand:- start:1262 stop:2167 length:906 start_codon:yes stop_codon:yes gene_type:complete